MPVQPLVFTCHEKTAYKGFMGAIFFVAILETVGVSFLLYQWHVLVHFLHLFINVFFMLFLFIDTKKVINQPIWLQGNALHFAVGVRPKIVIPLANIQEVRSGSVQYEATRKKKNVLDLSIFVMEEPTLELVLKEPITCKGLLGKTKDVRHVFFFVDEKETFIKEIDKKTVVDAMGFCKIIYLFCKKIPSKSTNKWKKWYN